MQMENVNNYVEKIVEVKLRLSPGVARGNLIHNN